MSQKYELRPYQEECKEVLDATEEGSHLVVLATGLGKTVVFTHLKRNGRVLILSHRDELVRQPEKYYEGECSFGVEKASEHSDGEEVVSASVQSLSRPSRLVRYSPDDFDTIIIDEAHHCAAKTYRQILDYFTGAKRKIGFTATPSRGDGVQLANIFDDIIFQRDLRWGIENHYLSRIRCEQISGGFSLKGVDKRTGDYAANQLEEVLSHGDTIALAARAYVGKCRDKHTIIYCVTKKICFYLEQTIKKLIPPEEADTVKVLTGDTPEEERRGMLNGFSDGRVKCLINCMVLTEGTDLPICDAIMNLRPTCNDSLYQQMAGRGTRLYEGKEYCLLIDIVPDDDGNARNFCAAPSLFGIDPTMLSEKQKELLTEKQDLLEYCDTLSGIFASKSRSIEMMVKNIDLFLDEKQEILERNAGNSLKTFIEDYLKEQKEKLESCGYDFGNLDVEIRPECSRCFKIIPCWDETIYLSKPDVLGNTTIQILKNEPEEQYLYAGQMKLKDAVAFVKKYCSLKEPFYQYSWDKTLQKAWMRFPATEKQYKRLRNDYKKSGLDLTEMSLNKLEASKLIDLSMRMKESLKKKQVLNSAVKKSKEAEQIREQLYKQNEEKKKEYRKSEARFEKMRNRVEERYQAKEAEKKEMLNRILPKEGERKEVSMLANDRSAAIPVSARITERQEAFLESLVEKAERKGFLLEDVEPDLLTGRQASVLIDFLLQITNNWELYGNKVFFPDLKEDLRNGAAAYRFHYQLAESSDQAV